MNFFKKLDAKRRLAPVSIFLELHTLQLRCSLVDLQGYLLDSSVATAANERVGVGRRCSATGNSTSDRDDDDEGVISDVH